MENQNSTLKQKDTIKLMAPLNFLYFIIADVILGLGGTFAFLFNTDWIGMRGIGIFLLILALVELFFYTNYRVTFNNDGFSHRTLFRKQSQYRFEDIEALANTGNRLKIAVPEKIIEVNGYGEGARYFVKVAETKGVELVDDFIESDEGTKDAE